MGVQTLEQLKFHADEELARRATEVYERLFRGQDDEDVDMEYECLTKFTI